LDNDPFGDGTGINTETDLSVNISKISQKIEQLREERKQILDKIVEFNSKRLVEIKSDTDVLVKELRKFEGLLEHIQNQKSKIKTILENIQDRSIEDIIQLLQDFIDHSQNIITKISKKQRYSEETKKSFIDEKNKQMNEIKKIIRKIQGKNKGCLVMGGGTKQKKYHRKNRKKTQKYRQINRRN